jgi:hypothetical protein
VNPRIHQAGFAVIILAGGYAAGRFSAPERVRTVETFKEDTESRERVRQLTAELETAKRHTRREVVTVVKPDGTRETHATTDTTVDQSRDTHVATETQRVEVKHVETLHESVTERSRPDWRVGPMVGFDLNRGAFAFGAHVERRILGPLSLGAFGLSNGTAGLSLSMEF